MQVNYTVSRAKISAQCIKLSIEHLNYNFLTFKYSCMIQSDHDIRYPPRLLSNDNVQIAQ